MLIMMHYNMPLCLCQRLQVSGLLKEAVIRDVVWDGRKGRLFLGDSLGRVAVTSLPKVLVICVWFGHHFSVSLLAVCEEVESPPQNK